MPDPVAVTRETLAALARNTASFIQHHERPDPAEGSVVGDELADVSRPELLLPARLIAGLLVESGWEHLSAFVRTTAEPVETIACLTCVRSLLEPCALAVWLLDPEIDAQERTARVFAVRYEGMVQQAKWGRALGGMDERALSDRTDVVEQDALDLGYAAVRNNSGKRIGIAQIMPSATELIRTELGEEAVYRLLSAVSHGHSWAIRELAYAPTSEARVSTTVSGECVWAFEKNVNVDLLAYLGLIAATACSRGVWNQCLYEGWDRAGLVKLLEETFDRLHAPETARFWRDVPTKLGPLS